MNKRFSLVLDEECLKILSGKTSKKKAEYVRNAIRHYSDCKSLEEKIERLENLVDKLESGNFSEHNSHEFLNSEKDNEEKDYILDGFLSEIENLE